MLILLFNYSFFVVNNLEAFKEMKLSDKAANRPQQYLKNKCYLTKSKKDNLEYKEVDTTSLLVEVKNKHKQTE